MFHTSGAANKESFHVSSPLYRENKPQKGGICVANHTSPIDVVILANDGCYAMVGITNSWVIYVSYSRWFDVMMSPLCDPCLTGGSDPRRPDGRHPEVDGEVVPSCLVREVRDERQTRCNQQVRQMRGNKQQHLYCRCLQEVIALQEKKKKLKCSIHDCFF